MAGFKTHITTSTVVGMGYGAAGYLAYDMPLPVATIAAGLCGVSGMLPDVDSDSGVPVRETTAFAAAVIPMLMLDRLQHLGLGHESIVIVGASIYILVRFGVGAVLKRYTVHRGMWHSIPAAAIAGLVAFLICSCPEFEIRMFKVGAVVLGYLIHLLLDELYSIDFRRGRIRFKKSSGTALKFWGGSLWGNVSTYGKLVLLVALAVGDPILMERFGYPDTDFHRTARQLLENVREPETSMR